MDCLDLKLKNSRITIFAPLLSWFRTFGSRLLAGTFVGIGIFGPGLFGGNGRLSCRMAGLDSLTDVEECFLTDRMLCNESVLAQTAGGIFLLAC